jgi:hypothetical protein
MATSAAFMKAILLGGKKDSGDSGDSSDNGDSAESGDRGGD